MLLLAIDLVVALCFAVQFALAAYFLYLLYGLRSGSGESDAVLPGAATAGPAGVARYDSTRTRRGAAYSLCAGATGRPMNTSSGRPVSSALMYAGTAP